MKSAKEMFENLGYEIGETPYYEKCIKYIANDGYIKRELEFWLDDKLFYNNLVYGDFQMKGSCPIPMELLQAINKQVEELGWNNTTVNIDVKLDGKKVMEAMRGGDNA